MDKSQIRVLVVDDSEPWRSYFSNTLKNQPGLEIIGAVSDGLEGVQRAEELRPDLITLDIGLPTLNGIEAARRVREVSPASKILFVSENIDLDIAIEALNTGASGYVAKSDAASELLPAVDAVLKGERFVSKSLPADGLSSPPDPQTGARFHRGDVVTIIPKQNVEARHHEVGFYSDDRHFLENVTRFIAAALRGGNSAIVAASESHRVSLLPRLYACGLDMFGAIEEGRYIALDAAGALSTFLLNGMPDSALFMAAFGSIIHNATKAARSEHPRVMIFGEGVHLLWAQGNAEAAIQIEKLCNKLTQIHNVDILCGYSLGSFESGADNDVFQRIFAEHSAIHTR